LLELKLQEQKANILRLEFASKRETEGYDQAMDWFKKASEEAQAEVDGEYPLNN
jgi:hypothetical protein